MQYLSSANSLIQHPCSDTLLIQYPPSVTHGLIDSPTREAATNF